MSDIARNHTEHFGFLSLARCQKNILGSGSACAVAVLLLFPSSALKAERIALPAFHEYNRSVNQGSIISPKVRFRGQPSDKLEKGTESPVPDGWGMHSTLTTGLFPVAAQTKKKLVFYVRAERKKQQVQPLREVRKSLQDTRQNLLWVSVRYYDRHGVRVHMGGGTRITVSERWSKNIIPFEPQASVKYAEVWFVKFQDADQTGEHPHAFYVSGLALE